MIRVAVIGSSHAGAIKDAEPRIRLAFPDVRLRFFAVPGGAFRRCQIRGGTLHARPASDIEARIVLEINDALSMSVVDFDQLWVVGHRFGFGAVLGTWLTDAAPAQTMARLVAESMGRIADQFGPDQRITLTPAPYPALRVRAPGPNQEPRVARILRHDDRDVIFTAYEACIRQTAKEAGYDLALQPAQTRAAPFATLNTYLQGALSFQTGAPMAGDLRHMNAEYGYAMFCHYAAQRLGLAPKA